jgi:predicted anti-sigma-YlaC factor YlaD
MKQHFTEADLLETYYTQPGESMPVMMHLADCTECAARYERLERKLRGLTACEHSEKPDTFWARQRISVMRKIDAQRDRSAMASRFSRVAAAAVLVVLLGGGVFTWREGSKAQRRTGAEPQVVQTATLASSSSEPLSLEASEPSDPWESDELSDFQSVVAWESWVESANGDKSL